MAIENRLHFMVPNPISTTAIGFPHPVTVSAEALSVNTLDMLIDVRESVGQGIWVCGVAIDYNGEVWTASKAIESDKLLELAKAPNDIQMATSKVFVYGVAEFIAYSLSTKTGLDMNFLTSCIRRFAKPEYTLVSTTQNTITAGIGELSELADHLPGVNEKVDCPALKGFYVLPGGPVKHVCNRTHSPLKSIIMHLNDGHKWSREQIADWLDKLYEEGVDLAFKDEAV